MTTYSFSVTYNSSLYYKKLTPYNILSDKPTELYWVRGHAYSLAIAEVTKSGSNKLNVLIRHLNSQASYGDTMEIVREYLDKNSITFSNGVGYLILVASKNNDPCGVVMDYFRTTYNERKVTLEIEEVLDQSGVYTFAAINASGSQPVVYHTTKGELDEDAFLLMHYFSKLTWRTKVQATKDGSSFMVEYIKKFYDISPHATNDFLYLNERVNSSVAVPKYIDTALISDMYNDYCFPNDSQFGTLYVEENIYPSLSTILYANGLSTIEGVTPLYNDMAVANVVGLFASNAFIYAFILAKNKGDYENSIKEIKQLCANGLVEERNFIFFEVTEEEAKEIGYVTV